MYMKERGRFRTIIDPKTNKEMITAWPPSREAALAEGVRFYKEPEAWKKCIRDVAHCDFGTCHTTITYTIVDLPACCARLNAADEYNYAIATGKPTDPGRAMTMGYDHYITPEPGTQCGHLGIKTISGKCYTCEQEKQERKGIHTPKTTPRQLAIQAGEKWYMPVEGDLCKNGHRALRRVENGICKQCEDEADKAHGTREKTVQELYPDMIIDYETAKATGFKVYRTGEPCRRGHRGWRYVSTRGCLSCKEG